MARSRKQIGYVYFVREEASGDIKIGYTSSLPNYRIAQLAAKQDKTLHIVGLMLGNKVTERSVHDDFAELALGGGSRNGLHRPILDRLYASPG